MNILDMVLNAQNGGAAAQVGRQFGLNEDQARQAISQLVPALSGGLKKNVSQPGGLDSLISALNSGGHDRYYTDPSALEADEAVVDGNAILGHLLGSKDVSRRVAQKAASDTGMDSSMMKQMLPIVASLVMGAVNGKAKEGGLLGGGSSSAGGAGDLLTSFLDSDGDGSMVDDLMGMASKFLR